MKKIVIGLSLAAALTAGGAVYAQGAMHRDGDGVATRAEAQAKAEERFTKRDANRDGKLDASDREARRAAMFDRMDADKNGQVSRAEFIAMHTMRQGMRAARHAGGDHAMNGEGRGGEMSGYRMGGRGMHGGMIRIADANGDGAITRQEFVTASLTRFDRGDANRDGQLTSEERSAARGAMRGRMREGGGTGRLDGTATPPSDASHD